MQFELLGYGQSVNELTIDFNLLTADIQRNVQIGNELAYRVSLIGVRGGYTREIMDDVTVYLKGAADLIGVGITQRRDGSKISGDGEGFGGELGAVLFDRVRIAVGGKTSSSNSDPQYKELGYYTCNDSFGRNGEYYSNSFHYSCYPAYSTHFQRSGVASSAYLSLVYDLMENLKVFGKASYNVYAFTDETGASANSRNEALLFILGVGGNF
jgi:hypothetical protein